MGRKEELGCQIIKWQKIRPTHPSYQILPSSTHWFFFSLSFFPHCCLLLLPFVQYLFVKPHNPIIHKHTSPVLLLQPLWPRNYTFHQLSNCFDAGYSVSFFCVSQRNKRNVNLLNPWLLHPNFHHESASLLFLSPALSFPFGIKSISPSLFFFLFCLIICSHSLAKKKKKHEIKFGHSLQIQPSHQQKDLLFFLSFPFYTSGKN